MARRVTTGWAIVVLAAGFEAAGGCVAGEEHLAVESSGLALAVAPEPGPGCDLEDVSPSLTVSVEGGDEADFALSGASHLVVEVRNDRNLDADGTLWARSLSEHGVARVLAARFAVPANGIAAVTVAPASIELPVRPLEFSGSLALWAEASYAGGRPDESRRLTLFFHPTDDGWRVYSRAVRDASFDGGALTAAARELRGLAVAAGADVVIRSPVRHTSDSTDFQPPAAADERP